MIRNFSVHVVRTEYDYNTYIPEGYRSTNPYESEKSMLPYLVIVPYKDAEDGILPDACKMTFDPTPDFTSLTELPDVCTISADGKYLNVDWSKIQNALLMAPNSEIYPNGEFANGECKVIMFDGDLEDPDHEIEVEVGEMSVSEAQALIALNFNQQGQEAVGKLLNTIATKVYGVTYNTPPIS